MLVRINNVSVQIIAERIEVDEIGITFYHRTDVVVAWVPLSQVDKVIDFGKVLYTRKDGLWVPEA